MLHRVANRLGGVRTDGLRQAAVGNRGADQQFRAAANSDVRAFAPSHSTTALVRDDDAAVQSNGLDGDGFVRGRRHRVSRSGGLVSCRRRAAALGNLRSGRRRRRIEQLLQSFGRRLEARLTHFLRALGPLDLFDDGVEVILCGGFDAFRAFLEVAIRLRERSLSTYLSPDRRVLCSCLALW